MSPKPPAGVRPADTAVALVGEPRADGDPCAFAQTHVARRLPTAPCAPPVAIFDTNVVLDWLWFADRTMVPIGEALARGRLVWAQSQAMQDELDHVLAHRLGPRPGSDAAAVRAGSTRWARRVHAAAAGPLRCRDDDDQKFIDLALALRARWLFTRDRALLALRRPARARGTEIIVPAAWPVASTNGAAPT